MVAFISNNKIKFYRTYYLVLHLCSIEENIDNSVAYIFCLIK
jgi:hypothetical protein